MNTISSLFKLKEWLTLDEAAQHLTVVLGEPVLEKDIYRLALDGHLQLSINIINGTQVHRGKYYDLQDSKWNEFLTDFLADKSKQHSMAPDHLQLEQYRPIQLEEKVTSIDGVWDLVMWGGARLDIEHYYQQLIGGPEVTLVSLDGALVERDGVVCEILVSFDENEYKTGSLAQQRDMETLITTNDLSSDEIKKIRQEFKQKREEYLKKEKSQTDEQNYYPSGGLPSDGVLVVRTEAMMGFLNSLGQGAEKPLSTKERYTLLVIIAALCENANIDYSQKGVASALQHLTENLGCPITDDTIRKVLKQINEAVDIRSK